jgi:hypothetical protein
MIDNFLFLEPLIVARLQEHLPSDVQVLTAPALADMAEAGRRLPAVFVVYDGYQVAEDNPGFLTVTQTWVTWAAVRNSANLREGAPAREDAGSLLHQMRVALSRWKPEGAKPLRLSAAPNPIYTDGHAYFPLAWTSAIALDHAHCN